MSTHLINNVDSLRLSFWKRYGGLFTSPLVGEVDPKDRVRGRNRMINIFQGQFMHSIEVLLMTPHPQRCCDLSHKGRGEHLSHS